MIINKKCTCGDETTGDTTIRCCNLCGLPLPNEPWHFNLDENIFSQVEKPVIQKIAEEIDRMIIEETGNGQKTFLLPAYNVLKQLKEKITASNFTV